MAKRNYFKKDIKDSRFIRLDLSKEEDVKYLCELMVKSYHKFKTVVDTYGKPVQ